MYIKEVRLKNFKSFYGEFKISFNSGVNILVGDNGVGKSTILEAIHLALSGYYYGSYIKHLITPYFWNQQVLLEYFENVRASKSEQPPIVAIELWFDEYPEFTGNYNSESNEREAGISFQLRLNNDFQSEFDEYIYANAKDSNILPVEYFQVEWRSFSRKDITARNIDLKSVFIDSTGKTSNITDLFVSQILKNTLSIQEKASLTHAHRDFLKSIDANSAISKINKNLKEKIIISDGEEVSLSADYSITKPWEYSIVANIDNIPMNFVGKGKQTELKTKLSLSKATENTINQVILIEEPENHLSFSKLNELIAHIKNNIGNKQLIITTHSSYVLNKLGLDQLILLSKEHRHIRFNQLTDETKTYFEKLSGYDTLRLILSQKAILVEGDSDELVIQKAYLDKNKRLPLEAGCDVISLRGLTFLRYLEIAEALELNVALVTDNDGNINNLEDKYKLYIGENKKSSIKICYSTKVYSAKDFGEEEIEKFNYNTLEPCIIKENSLEVLNSIFGTSHKTKNAMLIYMKKHKTDCALKIFEATESINYPQYILDAIK